VWVTPSPAVTLVSPSVLVTVRSDEAVHGRVVGGAGVAGVGAVDGDRDGVGLEPERGARHGVVDADRGAAAVGDRAEVAREGRAAALAGADGAIVKPTGKLASPTVTLVASEGPALLTVMV